MRFFLALLVALLLPAVASAQVVVANPTVRGKFAVATITTPTDDLLEGLSSPGGIAMIHTIIRAKMVRTAIPFKANKPRRLSTHGYHIMLMYKPFTPDLAVTLIFKNAGAVKVTFIVR